MAAVRHSQQYFGQFSNRHIKSKYTYLNRSSELLQNREEIKELMILLVRPDSSLSTDDLYRQIKNIFTEDYCALHKIPKHSLLYST